MTKIVAIAAMLASLMAVPAFADNGSVTDTQLSAIGLAGFQPMTDSQAATVRGKSYGHGGYSTYTVSAGVNGGAAIGQSGIGVQSSSSATNSFRTADAFGIGAATASINGHFTVTVIVAGFATAHVH